MMDVLDCQTNVKGVKYQKSKIGRKEKGVERESSVVAASSLERRKNESNNCPLSRNSEILPDFKFRKYRLSAIKFAAIKKWQRLFAIDRKCH